MAHELVIDTRVLDAQMKDLKRRITQAVTASKTSVTDIFCVGPIIAGLIVAYTGDDGSGTATASRPPTAPPPSRSPPRGGSFTASPGGATGR